MVGHETNFTYDQTLKQVDYTCQASFFQYEKLIEGKLK